jgi:hypothetical protein
MKYLRIHALVLAVLGTAGLSLSLASSPKVPKEPAKVRVAVAPDAVEPGQAASVTVRIEPIDGVKINRYPRIKLKVPARDGINAEAYVEIGNESPPPPETLKNNYFETVDPLELDVSVDSAAPAGRHDLEGKLTYYYCVTKSGFCAPARVPVTIPVAVR